MLRLKEGELDRSGPARQTCFVGKDYRPAVAENAPAGLLFDEKAPCIRHSNARNDVAAHAALLKSVRRRVTPNREAKRADFAIVDVNSDQSREKKLVCALDFIL